MSLARCYRRRLFAAASACCCIVLTSVASAQLDFYAGSLVESQSTFDTPFQLGNGLPAVPPSAEPLPPTLGSPVLGDVPLLPPPAQCLPLPFSPDLIYHLGGKARGYYINDQRIEFTGMEDTFAVEGVFDAGILQRSGDWEFSLESQIFLNQPFDRNQLADTRERRSFLANFDIDPLQISQLTIGARRGDYYVALGRFVTPFGRFYFPNYRNNFDDSPFIRSEAILFRETGLLLQWDPSIWTITAALTNGGFQQDANSSKALVARVGIDQPWYALGTSVKWQDGNGSEGQKAFNNHAGFDAMVRRGNWTLSGEAIYDQYGRRRPGTPLQAITWGRSLYYRDMNNGLNRPITGYGYYVNAGYETPLWTLMLNYGEFYPQQLGRPRHDAISRRGLVKASYHWTPHFETYTVLLLEHFLPHSFDNSTRRGIYVIIGGQFAW